MLAESDLRLIEAHHGIRQVSSVTLSDVAFDEPAAVAAYGPFDLEKMWRRGRFARSLQAPSGAASDKWRADNIDDLMPRYYDLPEHSPMVANPWKLFALCNGREKTALLKQSRLKLEIFDRLCQMGEQHDTIFCLPPWSPLGEPSLYPDLIYMTDSGILHHFLGLPDEELNNWNGRSLAYQHPQWDLKREKSWEGFAISCLIRASHDRARTSYWTASDGEIDLILDWAHTEECWAIEITLGRNKKIKSFFQTGCNAVRATRRIVVHNSVVGAPTIKGRKDVVRGIETMTLEAALDAVSAGP